MKKIYSIILCFILLFNFATSYSYGISYEMSKNVLGPLMMIEQNDDNIINGNGEITDMKINVDDGKEPGDKETSVDNSPKNNICLSNYPIKYSIDFAAGLKDKYLKESTINVSFKVEINYDKSQISFDGINTNDYEIKEEEGKQLLIANYQEDSNFAAPYINNFTFSLIPSASLVGNFVKPYIDMSVDDGEYLRVLENEYNAIKIVGNAIDLKASFYSSTKYKTNTITVDDKTIKGAETLKSLYSSKTITGDIVDTIIKLESADHSTVGLRDLIKGDEIDLDVSANTISNEKNIECILTNIVPDDDTNLVEINPVSDKRAKIKIEVNNTTPTIHFISIYSVTSSNISNPFQTTLTINKIEINNKETNINNNTHAITRDYLGGGQWTTFFSTLDYSAEEKTQDEKVNNHFKYSYNDKGELVSESTAHMFNSIAGFKPLSASIPIGKTFYAQANTYTKDGPESSSYKSIDFVCYFDCDVYEPDVNAPSYVNNGDMSSALLKTNGNNTDRFIKETSAYSGKDNGEVKVRYIGRSTKLSGKSYVSTFIKDSSLTYYKTLDELEAAGNKCIGVDVEFRKGIIKTTPRKDGSRILLASCVTPLRIKTGAQINPEKSSPIFWHMAFSKNDLGDKTLINGDANEITNPASVYTYITAPMHTYFVCNSESNKLYSVGDTSAYSSWKEWGYDSSYIETTKWNDNIYTIPKTRLNDKFDRFGTCVRPINVNPEIFASFDKEKINKTDNTSWLSLDIKYTSDISDSSDDLNINVTLPDSLVLNEEEKIFLNEDEVKDFTYDGQTISLNMKKQLNSKTDTFKINLLCSNLTKIKHEIIATVTSSNSYITPSISNNMKSYASLLVTHNSNLKIVNYSNNSNLEPNQAVNFITKISGNNNSNQLSTLTILSSSDDMYGSNLRGQKTKRVLTLDTNNIDITHARVQFIKNIDNFDKTYLLNEIEKNGFTVNEISVSGLSHNDNSFATYEIPIDAKVVCVIYKPLASEYISISQTISYLDNNNGRSKYLQNTYCFDDSKQLGIDSVVAKCEISENKYVVKYITDGHGKVQVESETVTEMSSPQGTTQEPFEDYIFKYWISEQDVKLANGQIILKDTPLSMSEITSAIVENDITFKACYRLVPILSVTKTSEKEEYNSNEDVIYHIEVTQIAQDTHASNVSIEDIMQVDGIYFKDVRCNNSSVTISREDNSFTINLQRLDYNQEISITCIAHVSNDGTKDIFRSDKADNIVTATCTEYIERNLPPAISEAKPYVFHRVDVSVYNGIITGIEDATKLKVVSSIPPTCEEYTQDKITSGSSFISYFAPKEDCYLGSINVDGSDVNANKNISSYEFSNIVKNHQIKIVYEESPDLNVTKVASKDVLDNKEELEYEVVVTNLNSNIIKNLIIEDVIQDGMKINLNSIKVLNIENTYEIKETQTGFVLSFNGNVNISEKLLIKYSAILDDKSKIINGDEVTNRIKNDVIVQCDGIEPIGATSIITYNNPQINLFKSADKQEVEVGDVIKYTIVCEQVNLGMIARDVILQDKIDECLKIDKTSLRIRYENTEDEERVIPTWKINHVDNKLLAISINNLKSGRLIVSYKAYASKSSERAENVASVSSTKQNLNSQTSCSVRINDKPTFISSNVNTGDKFFNIILCLLSLAVLLTNFLTDKEKESAN